MEQLYALIIWKNEKTSRTNLRTRLRRIGNYRGNDELRQLRRAHKKAFSVKEIIKGYKIYERAVQAGEAQSNPYNVQAYSGNLLGSG